MAPYMAGSGSIARRQSDVRVEMGGAAHTPEEAAEAAGMAAGMASPGQASVARTGSVDDEDLYELFSVMIHSGSAFGGHYYAYIKSMSEKKWYKFNDSTVSELDERDVEDAFGGSSSYTYSYSSANAYLLMYRKVCTRNVDEVRDDEVPPMVQTVMEADASAEKAKHDAREREYDTWDRFVHYQGKQFRVSVYKAVPLAEFKAEARRVAGIPEDIADENVRMRKAPSHLDAPKEAIVEREGIRTYEAMTSVDNDILLETREPGEEWTPYDVNTIVVKVAFSRSKGAEFSPLENVWVPRSSALDLVELKRLLAQHAGIPLENAALFKHNSYSYHSQPTVENLNRPRVTGGTITEGCILYMMFCDEPVPDVVDGTDMGAAIEKAALRQTIVFSDLDSDAFTHRLVISVQSTLAELKQHISETIGHPPEDFRLFKDYGYKGSARDELMRLQDPLNRQGLSACALYRFKERLLVQRPKAVMLPLKLVLLQPEKAAVSRDMTEEDVPKIVEPLGEFEIDSEGIIRDVKVAVAAHLAKTTSHNVPPTRLRLREISAYNGQPGNVLVDDLPFKQGNAYLYTRKGGSLGVQILEGDEEPKKTKDVVVLEVQRWHAAEYRLGPRQEVRVAPTMLMSEFKQQLATLMDVPTDHLEVAKATAYMGNPLIDISTLKWSNMERVSVYSYPVTSYTADTVQYHSSPRLDEGTVLYIRDKRETIMDLPKEDKDRLEKIAIKERAAANQSDTWGRERRLKIKGGGPRKAAAGAEAEGAEEDDEQDDDVGAPNAGQ